MNFLNTKKILFYFLSVDDQYRGDEATTAASATQAILAAPAGAAGPSAQAASSAATVCYFFPFANCLCSYCIFLGTQTGKNCLKKHRPTGCINKYRKKESLKSLFCGGKKACKDHNSGMVAGATCCTNYQHLTSNVRGFAITSRIYTVLFSFRTSAIDLMCFRNAKVIVNFAKSFEVFLGYCLCENCSSITL
jgi:hypothetical protein